ncbi:exopolysaccharide biosynthesis GT4 family glycosyltransferase EpsE [uncultured Roseobacter sp.]|uniref:exopolysaccharide biosynthesis GT4 family glycosyltransferase EpsE n=1 Tax=uncultured Roseobacter sp. TaxID=114847 RepID=UPI002610F9FB|nr:exopolysaccharide biosynthesis GT4 family glycosyltransferase EpsE [uncultured Roseobacter sp.]
MSTPHPVSDPAPIGYMVPEFPAQTHAFFWREMGAIEEAGVPVTLLSTRRPPAGACPHAFAEAARNRTRYLFPPDMGAALALLARHPGRLLAMVRYILGLHETPLATRLKFLALIPSAADLAALCAEKGIVHVHIHSCANAAHLGAMAHILTGLTYSLTLHGDLPVYGTDHKAKMARATFVSAVTAPLQRSLRDEISPTQPYPVIWMGVDTETFKPDPAQRKTRPEGRFEVVTVARLNNMKGHRYFLRAMAELRREGIDVHYRIAGDGPEQAAIETEIAKLGLGDHVTLLGSVDEAVVLELLQSSDALALTSINKGEAAPVAVMEAMSCGVPPICSIIGGTGDMITDGEDGFLVPQKDVAAITEAARRLATDPGLRATMGQAARQTAQAKFDHRRNALALYEEIRKTAG